MDRSRAKAIARAAAAVAAVSGMLGSLGLSLLDGEAPAGAIPAEAVVTTAPSRLAAPYLDQLLEVADYVSDDGSYVRVGEVEISATAVARRAPGS